MRVLSMTFGVVLGAAGVAPAMAAGWTQNEQLGGSDGARTELTSGGIEIGFQCSGTDATLSIDIGSFEFRHEQPGGQATIFYAIKGQPMLGILPSGGETGAMAGHFESNAGGLGVSAVAARAGSDAIALARTLSEGNTISISISVNVNYGDGLSGGTYKEDATLAGARDSLSRVLGAC